MADSSGMDLSALLAPWMAQDPTDPSQYGGIGQLGASLLAASGPTPYKQPGMVALANGMMAGQQNALKMAQQRMQLGTSSVGLQRALMQYAMMRQALQGGAPTPDSTQTAPPGAALAAAAQPQPQQQPPYFLAADPNASSQQGAQQSPTTSAPVGDSQQQAPGAPWMDPVTEEQIESTPVGEVSPGFYRANALFSQNPAQALGALREQQLKIRQEQIAPQVAQLDGLIKSDHPAQYAQSSQGFMARWPTLAKSMGVDINSGFNDQNVRRALGMVRNPLAASVGMPTIEVPEQGRTVSGDYGQQLYLDPITNKPSEVSPMKLPTFDLQKNTDTSGKQTGQLVQTGGWFGAYGLGKKGGSSAPAPNAGRIDLGYAPPSTENNKAAMFASEMRSGLQTLNTMEKQGYKMSPQARAVAISMATDESSSPMGQLFQQEIAAHAISKEDQLYISAMMPLLQAAGHDQSGARLTTAQIRQNVESLLPFGSNGQNLEQVHKNRAGFYSGLLTQAGPALRNPKYRSTLLADENHLENDGQTPAVPANIQKLLDKYGPK